MTIDWDIISRLRSESFNPNDIIGLIKDRFKIFSSFPVIEIFCYFAIVFLLIFKPLTKEALRVNEN
jgi:fucose permease